MYMQRLKRRQNWQHQSAKYVTEWEWVRDAGKEILDRELGERTAMRKNVVLVAKENLASNQLMCTAE